MKYWRNELGDIYWGDKVNVNDVHVDEKEGSAEYRHFIRSRISTSALKAKTALLRRGVLESVDEYMLSPHVNSLLKLTYASSDRWCRTDHLTYEVGAFLNMSEEDMDALYTEANDLLLI